jgi:hypothetical protein
MICRNARAQSGQTSRFVMAGLVPTIHVLDSTGKKDVDARLKAGHDDGGS